MMSEAQKKKLAQEIMADLMSIEGRSEEDRLREIVRYLAETRMDYLDCQAEIADLKKNKSKRVC